MNRQVPVHPSKFKFYSRNVFYSWDQVSSMTTIPNNAPSVAGRVQHPPIPSTPTDKSELALAPT